MLTKIVLGTDKIIVTKRRADKEFLWDIEVDDTCLILDDEEIAQLMRLIEEIAKVGI